MLNINKPLNKFEQGEQVNGIYLLKECEIKETKTGSTYMTGVLCDSKSQINFKYWDYTGAKFPTGIPVVINSIVDTFNGNKHLKIQRIRYTNSADNYDINMLIPTAPIDINEYRQKLETLCESIIDPDYKKLIQHIKNKYIKEIMNAPAAKSLHHSFIHGLLMHSVNIMTLADEVSKIYKFLNRDLLITAALMHDIGKPLLEFKRNNIGLVDDYTIEGNLLGHLVGGSLTISNECKSLQIPHNKTIALLHCILSHHGQLEWGAAVKPQTPEAEMLSKLDQIDAVMENFRTTMENMNPNETSKPISFLGGRRIVKL